MNISDFAKSRGLEPQTVSRYISRHSDDFDGLITRDGKSVNLSEEALDKLDQIYPNPKPVEVIVDHVSRDKLLKAQEQIIHLQQQLVDQAALVADAKYHQLLLAQRDAEIERERETVSRQKEEIDRLGDQISSRAAQIGVKEDEIRRLQAQLASVQEALSNEQARRERMEQSGIISRIFKTWK